MINGKFVRKYMRLAKQVGEDMNPCYSRNIGVVIVNPLSNKILGMGYNGPPKGTPHCDSSQYLKDVVWPQLTEEEKEKLIGEEVNSESAVCTFIGRFAGSKKCPRKIIGCGPGEKSHLCSCQHAERNAITNAQECLLGAWMFCWCGVPCDQCTGAIINADIHRVYCLDSSLPDYSFNSRYLLRHAGVELILLKEEECLSAL